METEVKVRGEEELDSRNKLQRELVRLYLEDGLIKKTDTEMLIKLFKQVSDIIGSDDSQFESIRAAFKAGDNSGAAAMLKAVIKL